MFDRLVSLSVGTEGAEDYFATFQDISELARNLGDSHGYVSVSCSTTEEFEIVEEDKPEEELYYDEFTLVKVRQALEKALVSNAERAVADIVTDCISAMQSVGILFRERPRSTENSVGDRR